MKYESQKFRIEFWRKLFIWSTTFNIAGWFVIPTWVCMWMNRRMLRKIQK